MSDDQGPVVRLPRTLRGLRRLFGDASATTPPGPGEYRVSFVGPPALRVAAPRAIALGGMAGWAGKRFGGDGTAVNLLDDGRGGSREVLPMRVRVETSWLDGRPAIVCAYGADAPLPWRFVRDEFRVLADGRLLGLTFAGGPWSRPLASPFVLERGGG